MIRQLTFDLPSRVARGREDFFVSDANALAVQAIDAWQGWPMRKLLLTGAQGAGKSHLAAIWAEESGAVILSAKDFDPDDPSKALEGHKNVVLEDIDRDVGSSEREQILFHAHNMTLEAGGHLLMTSRAEAWALDFALPDLVSRVKASHSVALDAPDDALLAAVLVKLFSDRQLETAPNLVEYLLKRVERSFSGAQAIVARLDQGALSRGRNLTRSLARDILDNEDGDGDA